MASLTSFRTFVRLRARGSTPAPPVRLRATNLMPIMLERTTAAVVAIISLGAIVFVAATALS